MAAPRQGSREGGLARSRHSRDRDRVAADLHAGCMKRQKPPPVAEKTESGAEQKRPDVGAAELHLRLDHDLPDCATNRSRRRRSRAGPACPMSPATAARHRWHPGAGPEYLPFGWSDPADGSPRSRRRVPAAAGSSAVANRTDRDRQRPPPSWGPVQATSTRPCRCRAVNNSRTSAVICSCSPR